MKTFEDLKAKETLYLAGSERTSFTLRMHRAISWGLHAEQLRSPCPEERLDDQFVFYWISFNALYGGDFELAFTQSGQFNRFLEQLCNVDTSGELHAILLQEFNSVRVLLSDPYVNKSFWAFYKSRLDTDRVDKQILRINDQSAVKSKSICTVLVRSNETYEAMETIFEIVYFLRNQIIHGSSTYNGHVNRGQLKTVCNILSKLLPVICGIVYDNEKNPDFDMPEPLFPVVNV